jgi:hypothetical protein
LLLGRAGLVPGRCRRVVAREVADLAVERRGEQHRLPLARELAHDPLDLRLEAHVEHPVGLVQHERADAVEVDEPALDEVGETARRRDQDVGALRALRLGAERRTAVDGLDLQAGRLGHVAELVGHLRGELARRDEDESARRPVLGTGALEHGHAERERLARARRRLGEHVEACEGVLEHHRLDPEGRDDVAGGERLHDGRAHAERGKGLV